MLFFRALLFPLSLLAHATQPSLCPVHLESLGIILLVGQEGPEGMREIYEGGPQTPPPFDSRGTQVEVAKWFVAQSFQDPAMLASLGWEDRAYGFDRTTTASRRLFKFRQNKEKIPIFRSQVFIELDDQNVPLVFKAFVGDPKGVSATPSLSEKDALQALRERTNPLQKVVRAPNRQGWEAVPVETLSLAYFFDERTKQWRLVYLSEKTIEQPWSGKFLEMNLSDLLVDAQTGEFIRAFRRYLY